MKLLRLKDRGEYIITDEQARNIKRAIDNDARNIEVKKQVSFSSGSYSSIVEELPKIATWNGYIVDTRDWSFHRDGKKIFLEEEHLNQIEYKPNPKYKILLNQKRIKAPKISNY